MANRYFTQFQLSAVKGLVNLYPALLFNGASNPTLKHWSPGTGGANGSYITAPSSGTNGVLSCTRTGAGTFDLVLQDTYCRVLGASITFMAASTAPAGPVFQLVVPSIPSPGFKTGTFNTVTLKFWGPTSSAVTTLVATDPAATEFGVLALQLQNSTAL